MSIKMYRMLFLRSVCVCVHTSNTHAAQYIYSIKVCIRSVKIFSFCPSLSPSFLSFFTRFTRFVSLDRPRIVSSNSKRKKKRRRRRRRSIIVLNRLFFLLSTIWWTQVIRERERERKD